MAFKYYMSVKGQKQGQIYGSGDNPTHDPSKLTILGFDLSAPPLPPRDQASGLASGKRPHKPVYKPVTIVKGIDKASGNLQAASATNEVLSAIFYFEAPSVANAIAQIMMPHIKIAKIQKSGATELIVFVPASDAQTQEFLQFDITYKKIMALRLGSPGNQKWGGVIVP